MVHDVATWLVLTREAGDLEGQIYRALRARILAGALKVGERLPSTRALALALGISRSTASAGYERLRAEGFLIARGGAATRVAAAPPAPLGVEIAVPLDKGGAGDMPKAGPPPSWAPAVPHVALAPPVDDRLRALPFRPGLPDLESFPHALWARCLAARARSLRVHDMGYGEPLGLASLREAICEHLRKSRGLVADAAQIVITPSTVSALEMVAEMVAALIAGGRPGWIENPGYPAAQMVLARWGRQVVPVDCDEQGIDITRAQGAAPSLIYVTPSHQYPGGMAMPLARRLELLDFARGCAAMVIEDDYDSEFHYAARPLAALQGIDAAQSGPDARCVIYLGTFSKVLAPGLRVAYAVLPRAMLAGVRELPRIRGGVVSVHVQAALADFMTEGHLRSHIRRMRGIYRARMLATAEVLRARADGRWRVGPVEGGLQIPVYFNDPRFDDVGFAARLQACGVGAQALSQMYLAGPRAGLWR